MAELGSAANDEPDREPDPTRQLINRLSDHANSKVELTERRRAKALSLLEANPNWQRFVVVEAGDPTIIGIAIRSKAYGELEVVLDRFDVRALLELLDRYGEQPTVH